MDRLSPASVDSGFESLCPNSPACSTNSTYTTCSTDSGLQANTSKGCTKVRAEPPLAQKNRQDRGLRRRTDREFIEFLSCEGSPSASCSTDSFDAVTPKKESLPSSTCTGPSNAISGDRQLEAFVKCKWGDCTQLCHNHDVAYDHVIETHIRCMTEPCLPSTSKKTPKVDSDDDEEEEDSITAVSCRWSGCNMKHNRGSWCKKITWLEEHFKTRHSRRARPHKCLIADCESRFTTSRQLEEHVRGGHINTGDVKKPQKKSEKKTDVNSCYGCKYIPNFENCEDAVTVWDDFSLQKMFHENAYSRRNDFKMSYVPIKREICGSKKRKTFGCTRYKLVPTASLKSEESPLLTIAQGFDSVAESDLTLEALFPGWGLGNRVENTSRTSSPEAIPDEKMDEDEVQNTQKKRNKSDVEISSTFGLCEPLEKKAKLEEDPGVATVTPNFESKLSLIQNLNFSYLFSENSALKCHSMSHNLLLKISKLAQQIDKRDDKERAVLEEHEISTDNPDSFAIGSVVADIVLKIS